MPAMACSSGGVLYTTQPLYAPLEGGGTLTPDQGQLTTLGQANTRFKLAGQELSVGRQLIRTAFINPQDKRMIPLTFEGVILVPERRDDQGFDYIASDLWKYEPRYRRVHSVLGAVRRQRG